MHKTNRGQTPNTGVSPLPVLPLASSITFQHVAAVLNTLLTHTPSADPVLRILDVGCGEGKLISFLLRLLPALNPHLRFELYGVDVNAWSLLEKRGRKLLADRHPEIDWQQRLNLVSPGQRWPLADNFFDFMTSNQVIEHVGDHEFLLREIRRCLRPGGVSINLFPAREVLWEGHAYMPIVHRIRDAELRGRIMLFMALLGFRRRFHIDRDRRGWTTMAQFAEAYSRTLERNTNYLTIGQLIGLVERCGMDLSFTYTKDFFLAKALSWFGARRFYYQERGWLESAALSLCKYLASITVLLKKRW